MPLLNDIQNLKIIIMNRIPVIGSGFGGIALAIRLQAANIPTLLLDKRDKPGGRAYVYQDKGFTFDAGPTVITDPSAIEELFLLAGKKMSDYIELLPISPFYRLQWQSGEIFDYGGDQDKLEKQIARFNPDDVQGYREFIRYSKAVFKTGYLKYGTSPFLSFRSMVCAMPSLVRLSAWKSVYGIVSKHIKNEHLRQAFSFHSLLIGGNPFTTSSIYTLIHTLEREGGVWFPRGGTGALVNALVKLFIDIGGVCKLDTQVESFITNNNRITAIKLNDQREIYCKAAASNADVIHTYEKLLGKHRVGKRRSDSLKEKKMSNSLFVIYFGLNKLHSQLAHHTICFGNRYKELLDDIFKGNSIPGDFSLYLHSPSVTDPTLAPPGCASYYVLAPVPHLGNAQINWLEEGPRLRDRIFSYLEKYYIPGLRDQLVTHKIFTPFDFRDELNAYHGSAFSIAPLLLQSAWFRPHNRDSDIKNLYIVGAGTHPGAGIPGVLASAKITADLMIEDLS